MKTNYKTRLHILLFISSILIGGCSEKETLIKKDPTIIWEAPFDISYGTKLSSLQLNATSDIEGVFNYSHPVGTILPEGYNQELTVNFTPGDADNYNTASKTIFINVISPSIQDIEGNDYNIVTIGTQIWMAENLRSTKYRNGDAISNITDQNLWENSNSGAYCWYNNDKATNKAIYGALYNGYAVFDDRNIAPDGWRIPTEEDWLTLIGYLGAANAGGKMKLPENHWHSPNTGASNESGFSATPGGFCGVFENPYFSYLGDYSYYWCKHEVWSTSVKFFTLSYDSQTCGTGYADKNIGFSIRCIRDN